MPYAAPPFGLLRLGSPKDFPFVQLIVRIIDEFVSIFLMEFRLLGRLTSRRCGWLSVLASSSNRMA
ncbi:hypothetical protein PSAC2689_70004 [Paraburkholderia sacchari]